MGHPAKRLDRRFSYADYLTWDDAERWELIDGEAYAMSPAPGAAHQAMSGELFLNIAPAAKERGCRAFTAPMDVRLPPHPGAADEVIDTVVQPDLLVVCDRKKIDHKGILGAPDLVIEILSPTTSMYDANRKLKLYERAGVREYWLVDPETKRVSIQRLDESGRYDFPLWLTPDDAAESVVLPGLVVDLGAVFRAADLTAWQREQNGAPVAM